MISPATSELIFTCTTGCSLPLPVIVSIRFRRSTFSVVTVTGLLRLQPLKTTSVAISLKVEEKYISTKWKLPLYPNRSD